MSYVINFPRINFLNLLVKSVGNSKYNSLIEQIYQLKKGDNLLIQTMNESFYYCNFLSFTIAGEMVVNFQGKGFSTISTNNIKNISII